MIAYWVCVAEFAGSMQTASIELVESFVLFLAESLQRQRNLRKSGSLINCSALLDLLSIVSLSLRFWKALGG